MCEPHERGDVAAAQREHALARAAPPLLCIVQRGAVRGVERHNGAVRARHRGALGEEHVRAALDEHPALAGVGARLHGGEHPLVARVEGDLEQLVVCAEQRGRVDPEGGDGEGLGETQDGGVGRVALDLALGDREVGGGGVELGAVAEAADHVQRAKGSGGVGIAGSGQSVDLVRGVFSVEESDVLDSLGFQVSGGEADACAWVELTILPRVSVPVLSEQRTDMQPRVSIVARFLTRTLRFAMRLATMVKESATQTGRP